MNRHALRGLTSLLTAVLVVVFARGASTAPLHWTGAAGTSTWHSCQPCNSFETFVSSNWTTPCAPFPERWGCQDALALPDASDDVILDNLAPSLVWLDAGAFYATHIHSLTIDENHTLRTLGGFGNPPITMSTLSNAGTILFDQGQTYGVTLLVGSGDATPVITNSGTLRPLTGDDWDQDGHNLIGGLTNFGAIDGDSGYLNIDGALITQAGGSISGRGIQITGPPGSHFVLAGGTVGDSLTIASTVMNALSGTIGFAYINSDTLQLNGSDGPQRAHFNGTRLNVLAPSGSGKLYPLTNGADIAYYASTGCTLVVWNRTLDLVTDVTTSSILNLETTGSNTSTLNAGAGASNSGLIRFAATGSVPPVLSFSGTFTNAPGGAIRSDIPLAEIRNGAMVNDGLIEVPPGKKLFVYSPSFTMDGGSIIAAPDSANGGSAFRMQPGTTFIYNGGTVDTVSLTQASGDVRSGAGPGTFHIFNRVATLIQNQSPTVTWLLGSDGTGTDTLKTVAGAENRGKIRFWKKGTNPPTLSLAGQFSNFDTLRCDVESVVRGGELINTGAIDVAPAGRLLVFSPTFMMNGGSIVATSDSVNGGSTFRIQSGSTFVYNGGTADTVSFTTGGIADVRSGAGPGTLVVFNRGATLLRNESAAVSFLLGTSAANTATLTLATGATNRGKLIWNSKGTQNPVLSLAGACTNSAEGIISSQINAGTLSGSGILTNIGTLRTEAATTEIQAGSRLGNYASGALTGGRYDMAGKLRITGAAITKLDAEVLLRGSSAGVLNQSGGANALAALATVRAQGALRLLAGHRFNTTAASFSDSGTVEVADACTLQVGGGAGSLTVDSIGVLTGAGQVLANVTNRGTVMPGASAGRLSVQGGYTQSGTGRLIVELAGDSSGVGFDVLAVSGAASLGGTVEVRFIDGYSPPAFTSFDILTASGVTGQFTTVSVVGGEGVVLYGTGKATFVSGDVPVGVPPPPEIAPDPNSPVFPDSSIVPGAGNVVDRFGITSIAPNPFRTSTFIRFGLPLAESVRLEVYDATGRHVRTLAEGARSSGRHEVAWDGRDQGNAIVSPGIYFARLSASGEVSNWKFLFLR